VIIKILFMFLSNLSGRSIILATASPRRQQLFGELGIPFKILVKEDIEEIFPEHLVREEIALYLARLKSENYHQETLQGAIVITADTIVWVNDRLVGKPTGREDAVAILSLLSGNKHTVYTGVCISSQEKKISFFSQTDVYFRKLETFEIEYYTDTFKPFDKAGAYGIQEWIGYIGIERIEGSYFNVMGLPVQRLYEELKHF
jgi:septum formation protein